ncbi:MAG: RagB/SusD family nutrient uptake outer membrane protein, partial [Ginsengibacter sp.]
MKKSIDMNKIKNFSIVLPVLMAVCLLNFGCKKFLDRKPLTSTLDDLKQGGLETQALGLYGSIRNSKSEPYIGDGFTSIPWLGLNAFRSDDQEITSDPGAASWHTTFDLFGYAKDDWASGVYWDKHYLLIGQANTILQTADSLKLSDPGSLINVAEAKFYRALSYWDLVRCYGSIPKIDFRIFRSTDANVPKSPESEIYALIDADLTFAAATLPPEWSAKFNGRLTSGAAKTLLAKSKLYNKQWGVALALCKEVINSNLYDLFTPYALLWKPENKLNKESIFEIQASEKPGDGGLYWSWFGTTQGVRGADADGWNLGWGWNTPTQKLVDAYEPGDPRKPATILFSGQSDDPSNGGYGRTVPPYTNSLYWNKKAYVSVQQQQAAGEPNGASFEDLILLRYADVLLMAAEAANETGDGAYAAEQLEKIRARARGNNASVLPPIAFVNQAQMRTAIKAERRVEFGMEFERFFDLVRWGDASTVLAPLGYKDKNRIFPLPTTAIAANPNLVQNPDYP